MLLAIDIGNTNIVIGVFQSDRLIDFIRVSTKRSLTVDECGFLIETAAEQMKIKCDEITSAIVCSVVPSLTSSFEKGVKKYFKCDAVIVSHRNKLPITIAIDQPDQLGADRIANAVAGYRKFGGPIIVVDFGTAITFDVIDDKGAYLGGVIAPGPETSMTELARKAARLFEVRIEPPDRVVGKSTAGALKSGLFYGTIGQVDYIIDQILKETGFDDCRIVATGGLSEGIENYSQHIKTVDPTLTLEGLRLISEMNER